MKNNVVRLAELLQKNSLTIKERREGMTLAQAMFGTQAMASLDSVLVGLKSKAIVEEKDDLGNRPDNTVKEPETPEEKQPEQQPANLETKSFGFDLNDDVYSATQTKSGQVQYRKNGKLIKADEFEAARRESAGEPADESEV